MPQCQLNYGTDKVVTLDLPAETHWDECGSPAAVSLDFPETAVAAALVDPLGYPPLSASTVPGDRVVLAVNEDVPQPSAVVAAVVKSLLEGHCQATDMLILLADESLGKKSITQDLPREIGLDVHVAVHDPNDNTTMAYLAAAQDGQPIYISRAICDADLAIPIGCALSDDTLGYLGVRGGVFPMFADESTRRRFRAPSAFQVADSHEKHRREADEAAWLLGARFTVQIIPGGSDSILHVLAGDIDQVAAESHRLCSAAWESLVAERASLVVASIPGPPNQQTWTNFARALHASMRVVEDNGTIVVCSDIKRRPGPAFQKIAAAASLEEADRDVRRLRTEDAIPASQLIATLESARVYLISGVDADSVEELGIAPIASHDELNHLCQQHTSCLLLANSQCTMPRLRNQESSTP